MRNKRPSNTIINALLLISGSIALFLLGSFLVTFLNNDENVEDSMYKINQEKRDEYFKVKVSRITNSANLYVELL